MSDFEAEFLFLVRFLKEGELCGVDLFIVLEMYVVVYVPCFPEDLLQVHLAGVSDFEA